jgi:hypothetical protein
MNRPDQLRSHLARARDNGVTHEEVVEVITHWRSTPAGQTQLPRSLWPERFSRRSRVCRDDHASTNARCCRRPSRDGRGGRCRRSDVPRRQVSVSKYHSEWTHENYTECISTVQERPSRIFHRLGAN